MARVNGSGTGDLGVCRGLSEMCDPNVFKDCWSLASVWSLVEREKRDNEAASLQVGNCFSTSFPGHRTGPGLTNFFFFRDPNFEILGVQASCLDNDPEHAITA